MNLNSPNSPWAQQGQNQRKHQNAKACSNFMPGAPAEKPAPAANFCWDFCHISAYGTRFCSVCAGIVFAWLRFSWRPARSFAIFESLLSNATRHLPLLFCDKKRILVKKLTVIIDVSEHTKHSRWHCSQKPTRPNQPNANGAAWKVTRKTFHPLKTHPLPENSGFSNGWKKSAIRATKSWTRWYNP